MTTLALFLVLAVAPAPAPMPLPAIVTNLALPAAKNRLPLTDDSIRDQVMIQLAGNQVVKGGAIDVEVKDGVVTLKGTVTSDDARRKAEKIAKHVKGVKSVVNQLTIKEA